MKKYTCKIIYSLYFNFVANCFNYFSLKAFIYYLNFGINISNYIFKLISCIIKLDVTHTSNFTSLLITRFHRIITTYKYNLESILRIHPDVSMLTFVHRHVSMIYILRITQIQIYYFTLILQIY